MSPSHGKTFSDYIEPAVVLTILTGAAYLVGWQHLAYYYGRLGLETSWLNLSTSAYLTASIPPLFIGAYALHQCLTSEQFVTLPRASCFASYLPLILAYVLACVPYSQPLRKMFFNVPSLRLSLLLLVFIALAIVLARFKISFRDLLVKGNGHTRIVSVAVLCVLVVFFARAFGIQQAIYVIQGGGSHVELWTKDAKLSESLGSDLILIMYRDQKYYVIRKTNPAPEVAEVFIIPDSEVSKARITKSLSNYYPDTAPRSK